MGFLNAIPGAVAQGLIWGLFAIGLYISYKILDIERNHVIIALGKNTYKAHIGEEFKVSAISGSAEYMSQNQGGGRQYYTLKNEDSSSNNENKLRYVSESDVIINAR